MTNPLRILAGDDVALVIAGDVVVYAERVCGDYEAWALASWNDATASTVRYRTTYATRAEATRAALDCVGSPGSFDVDTREHFQRRHGDDYQYARRYMSVACRKGLRTLKPSEVAQ